MVFAMLTTPSPVNSASYPSAASELPPARGGHNAHEIGGDSNKQSESDDPELIGSANAQLVVNPKALQGSRLRLRLPDGRSVTALRDHSNSGHPNTFAWVGHLEGEPLSRVIFGSATASEGGSSVETMAGSVDRTAYIPGDRWHLLPSGRGPYTFKLGTINDFTVHDGNDFTA